MTVWDWEAKLCVQASCWRMPCSVYCWWSIYKQATIQTDLTTCSCCHQALKQHSICEVPKVSVTMWMHARWACKLLRHFIQIGLLLLIPFIGTMNYVEGMPNCGTCLGLLAHQTVITSANGIILYLTLGWLSFLSDCGMDFSTIRP